MNLEGHNLRYVNGLYRTGFLQPFLTENGEVKTASSLHQMVSAGI